MTTEQILQGRYTKPYYGLRHRNHLMKGWQVTLTEYKTFVMVDYFLPGQFFSEVSRSVKCETLDEAVSRAERWIKETGIDTQPRT